MHQANRSDPTDPGRRRLLKGILTAYTASLIPWAVAAPVANDTEGAFTALSAILVGESALYTRLGTRLHAALAAASPHFDADVKALLDLIDRDHIDPARLQAALDGAQSPLAPLPRKLMRAWCLGFVDAGDQVQCLAYEHALDNVFVGDVLQPPTYAYGPYGSWSAPPAPKKEQS